MATIKDIAKAAKVSVGTVSTILRDLPSPLITDKTRRRVKALAEELGYRPNPMAQSLRSRRTHTIGMIVPNMHGFFMAERLDEIERYFSDQGFFLLTACSYADAERELKLLDQLGRGRCDGLLIWPTGALVGPNVDALRALEVPFVLLNGPADSPFPGSHENRRKAVGMMVDHLVSRGRRRLQLQVMGPEHPENFRARERRQAFLDALLARHLPQLEPAVVSWDRSGQDGLRHAQLIAAMPERPDAVMCGTDMAALELIDALDRAGLRVPGDLSVVGWGNLPTSAYARVPLTTLETGLSMISRKSAETLHLLIQCKVKKQKPPRFASYQVDPELLIRASG
ncbi:LacI family DNA-binding transcriptional regulator [bacterium]|nr:LacI family DNA-binding transcriptional regulator [bacterium]